MPLRSGRNFKKDDKLQPTARRNAPRPRKDARNGGKSKASKQPRSTTDTTPTYPQLLARLADHEQVESPPRKRAKTTLAQQMTPGSAQGRDIAKAIDLTLDDDLTVDHGHISWPVSSKPKYVHKGSSGITDGLTIRSRRGTRAKARSGATAKANQDHGQATVMFTLAEAIEYLDHVNLDSSSVQKPPYTVQTGEHVPFPVTKSYHLGGMGRYGHASSQYAQQIPQQGASNNIMSTPFEPYVPLDPRSAGGIPLNSSSALPIRPSAAPFTATLPSGDVYDASRRSKPVAAQAYALSFGPYRGKVLDKVPFAYLQYIAGSPSILREHSGLQAALSRFLNGPIEVYRFEFGRFKGMQLWEVPEEYLLNLESDHKNLFGREFLQRALWNHNKKRGTNNQRLRLTLDRICEDQLKSEI